MTSKERNVLIGVIVIALIGAYYLFLLKPLNNDIDTANIELNALNNELNNLALEYSKKPTYEKGIEEMQLYIEEVEALYPAGVNQEMMIYAVKNLEQEIETLEIPNYSLIDDGQLVSSNYNATTEDGTISVTEGLHKYTVSLEVATSYDDLKKMLKYIQEQQYKLSVSNLALNSNFSLENVVASFELNFYALESTIREFIPEDYFGPYSPKENSIFLPYDDYGSAELITDGEVVITEEDDIMLSLSTVYADRSSVIIYKKDDLSGNSYVYADNNEMEPVEMVFDQQGDNYYFKYRTSTESYPNLYESSVQFIPGEIIDLHVYSAGRVDETDLAGANVTIINNTDLLLDIRIESDDVNNPRFNIVSQTGSISITNSTN